MDCAVAHQVVALAYQRVKALALRSPAARDALHTWQAFYAANAARNLRLRDELRDIAAVVHADHQQLLVLKGMHLAWAVYDDPGARQIADIDLLVPRDNLARVAHLFARCGYTAQTPYTLDPALFQQQLHLPPLVQQGRAAIEVHWNITPPRQIYSIDPGGLWQRAVPVSLGDTRILGLCPEDLVLYVCFHAAYQHEFEFGLRPFCDIAKIIQRYQPQLVWPDVVMRAQAWRWTRGVFLALKLARDLLGAAVPTTALQELRPASLPDDVLVSARTHVLTCVTSEPTLSPNVVAWHDAAWHRKVTLLARNVCVPTTALARRYGLRAHSPMVYLYYPVRLMTLLGRYGRTILDLWRGAMKLPPHARSKHTLHHWLNDANPAERRRAVSSAPAPSRTPYR
jgi:hypothetical protein